MTKEDLESLLRTELENIAHAMGIATEGKTVEEIEDLIEGWPFDERQSS